MAISILTGYIDSIGESKKVRRPFTKFERAIETSFSVT